MMGLLRQHEAAGACEWVEATFRQGRQLVLSVPVGEVGEHEEGQPVGSFLVEGAQNARLIRIARMPLQHLLRLFPAIAAEIAVQ